MPDTNLLKNSLATMMAVKYLQTRYGLYVGGFGGGGGVLGWQLQTTGGYLTLKMCLLLRLPQIVLIEIVFPHTRDG